MMLAGNFYLFWLLLVTMAFLYNAAVGPLRTAFSRTPIYNVTGVYPAPATSSRADVTASDVINDTTTTSHVIDDVTSNNSLTHTTGNTYVTGHAHARSLLQQSAYSLSSNKEGRMHVKAATEINITIRRRQRFS